MIMTKYQMFRICTLWTMFFDNIISQKGHNIICIATKSSKMNALMKINEWCDLFTFFSANSTLLRTRWNLRRPLANVFTARLARASRPAQY